MPNNFFHLDKVFGLLQWFFSTLNLAFLLQLLNFLFINDIGRYLFELSFLEFILYKHFENSLFLVSHTSMFVRAF